MRKILGTFLVVGSILWVTWAFVLPVLDVITNPIRDRGTEATVTMLGEFRGGRLSIRDYFWTVGEDGYQREIGGVTYGWGTITHTEVVKEAGKDPKVLHVFYDDGRMRYSHFFNNNEDSRFVGWIVDDGMRSIEMGRKRLKEYRDEQDKQGRAK